MEEIKLTEKQMARVLKAVFDPSLQETTKLSIKEQGKLLAAASRFKAIQEELNYIAEALMDTDKETNYASYDEEALLEIYDDIKDAFYSLQAAKELLYEVALDTGE